MLDVSELTLGEVAMVEKLSDQSIATMGDESAPKALMMAAIAFVLKKREDPKYTFEQAKNMKMSELEGIMGDSSKS